MLTKGRIVFSSDLDDIKQTHHRLTLRFGEERARPPVLAGVLACTGRGREWTAVCNGRLSELRDAVAGLGAEILERESPSLDELFLARAGTPASAGVEG
jgi:ABC-2 type transport system ATP-binding protein